MISAVCYEGEGEDTCLKEMNKSRQSVGFAHFTDIKTDFYAFPEPGNATWNPLCQYLLSVSCQLWLEMYFNANAADVVSISAKQYPSLNENGVFYLFRGEGLESQERNRQRNRGMEPTLSCHRAAPLLTAALQ